MIYILRIDQYCSQYTSLKDIYLQDTFFRHFIDIVILKNIYMLIHSSSFNVLRLKKKYLFKRKAFIVEQAFSYLVR